MVTPGDDGNNLCGVGINFKPDVTGALEVHSTVPGSPAAADTQIHQGDLLEQVRGGRRRSAAGGVRSEATSALSLIPAHAVGCCLRSSPPVHLQVDKHNVFRFPMKQVAGMLLGPSGTLVALTFQRRPADGQPFLRVHTVLRRVDVRALRISQPQDEVCMCGGASYCLSCTACVVLLVLHSLAACFTCSL